MLHQHDVEIKIHNDMIQILEDVNEINITLKIMQTCLQKENRNKNVVRIMPRASHRDTGKRRVNQVNEVNESKRE